MTRPRPRKDRSAAGALERTCSLLALVVTPVLAAPPPSPQPFLNFRAAQLAYPGPDLLLTNHHEIPLVWFGPTNLDHPLAGDLWWAACEAVREANLAHPTPNPTSVPKPHANSDPAPAPLPWERRPLRLLAAWSDHPWGTGAGTLARTIYDAQPLAIIGSIDSATTHLAEQIAAKSQLPLVSPVATDPSVTLAGVSWTFACAPSDTALADALVQAMRAPAPDARLRPSGSVVLVASTDHASRRFAREIVRALNRSGPPLARRLDLPPGSSTLAPLTAFLAETPPDRLLLIAGPDDAARWLREVREHAPRAAVFGPPSLGHPQFLARAGPAAAGALYPALVGEPRDTLTAAAFADRFRTARGHDPGDGAVLTYDATRYLIAALRRAGPSRNRLRDELAGGSPWLGAAGILHFDGTGQNTRAQLTLRACR